MHSRCLNHLMSTDITPGLVLFVMLDFHPKAKNKRQQLGTTKTTMFLWLCCKSQKNIGKTKKTKKTKENKKNIRKNKKTKFFKVSDLPLDMGFVFFFFFFF